MNIVTSLNQAVCATLGTVTKSASAITESIETGANMIHNRAQENDKTDLHFVVTRTAKTLKVYKAELDADAELKAIYDELIKDW